MARSPFSPLTVALLVLTALFVLSDSSAAIGQNTDDLADRKLILQTIENFYIGDHTGSVKHKKLSMHPMGAYRYIDKSGKYQESRFRVDSDNADDKYTEELLSIEIYENVALARLRLKQDSRDVAEYKLMTIHKTESVWLITGISWGFGVQQ